MNDSKIQTSIAPWLSVRNSSKAVAFYTSAFGAIEIYRLEDPDGNAVVKLSINGAEFWLSDSPGDDSIPLGGNTIRIILTVTIPMQYSSKRYKPEQKKYFL